MNEKSKVETEMVVGERGAGGYGSKSSRVSRFQPTVGVGNRGVAHRLSIEKIRHSTASANDKTP